MTQRSRIEGTLENCRRESAGLRDDLRAALAELEQAKKERDGYLRDLDEQVVGRQRLEAELEQARDYIARCETVFQGISIRGGDVTVTHWAEQMRDQAAALAGSAASNKETSA